MLASLVSCRLLLSQRQLPPGEFEACLLEKINDARAVVGRQPLIMAIDRSEHVRAWSEWMRFNTFRHSNSSERAAMLPEEAFRSGENIAWWSDPKLPDCTQIHTMLMESPGH